MHDDYFALAVRDLRAWANPEREDNELSCPWCGNPLPLDSPDDYCSTLCAVQAETDAV